MNSFWEGKKTLREKQRMDFIQPSLSDLLGHMYDGDVSNALLSA